MGKQAEKITSTASESQRSNISSTRSGKVDDSMGCDEDVIQTEVDGWADCIPRSTIKGLIGLQALRILVQAVNTVVRLGGGKIEGGFAEMVIGGALLRHSQAIQLLILLM